MTASKDGSRRGSRCDGGDENDLVDLPRLSGDPLKLCLLLLGVSKADGRLSVWPSFFFFVRVHVILNLLCRISWNIFFPWLVFAGPFLPQLFR